MLAIAWLGAANPRVTGRPFGCGQHSSMIAGCGMRTMYRSASGACRQKRKSEIQATRCISNWASFEAPTQTWDGYLSGPACRVCRAAQNGRGVPNIATHSAGRRKEGWWLRGQNSTGESISARVQNLPVFVSVFPQRTGTARSELNAAVTVRPAHGDGQVHDEPSYHAC